MDKKLLRNKILKVRDNIIDKHIKDTEIYNAVINNINFINSKSIFIYVSYGSEVDTIKIIEKALSLGKSVYVPKTDSNKKIMYPVKIQGLHELIKGNFGILEPAGQTGLSNNTSIDLAIMPGVVFDRDGNRIGYGGGYYDKYLSQNNVSIYKLAIGYNEQVVENIVNEEHDIKYNELITNYEIIVIK